MIFRRVTARTIAQQYSKKVEVSTAPFQYALKTKSGCETVAHILLSTDGIGAYDLTSRNAMMKGLRHVVEGDRILPFVRAFYGKPSTYIWEDDVGDVHQIARNEGGEQDAITLLYRPTPCMGSRCQKVARGRETLSRILMICTSSANQTGSEKSMRSNICGTIPAYPFTRARRKYGREAVWSQQDVLNYNVMRKLPHQGPSLGEATPRYHFLNRGSRCWGCHWDTQTSSSVSCSGKSMNTRCCSSGSRSSQTSKLRGSSCRIVLPPSRTSF